MASFFQPGINDPAIAACDPGRFKIYCNDIIPSQQLLKTWYQTLNLSVGAAALFIPLVFLLFRVAGRLRTSKPFSFRRFRKRKKNQSRDGGTPPPLTAFKAAKSFRVYEESDGLSVQGEQRDYDLMMLPLTIGDVVRDGDSISRSSHLPPTSETAKMNIACVSLDALHLDPLIGAQGDGDELSKTATFLADLQARSNLGGIALRCSPTQDAKKLNDLLEVLYFRSVPIILLSGHDSDIWMSADFTYTAGVIIENACILPNGQRRDYFNAKSLRDVMAICGKERETRPEYFVGFLDLWEQRPHPSLIRRAVKLAEHFGAVIEHGPVSPAVTVGGPLKSAAQTLSGFEYLRRAELTELQKAWITETRKVWIAEGSDTSPEVSRLPIENLKNAIPKIDLFLQRKELPPSMELTKEEVITCLDPPSYTKLAPCVESFWEYSFSGQKLSTRGCYPMSTETIDEHFDHVVSTQKHLKELQLLQPVKGAELHRLLQAFQRFAAESESHELVHGLIDGLETHQIYIYKGLDTGFGVPEGVGYFWGVSHLRDETSDHPMDIFISLKAPNDATAVLHTWLAHYGVPRQRRFELEFEFEINAKLIDEVPLPINIKTSIDRSSPAEVLALLQLIRVSEQKHPFLDALKDLGESNLIGETSMAVWHHYVARKVLDGSVEVSQLLQERLEHFARLGVTSLPSLEALTSLYDIVYRLVEDSLFFGNRDPLNTMMISLIQAWDPNGHWLTNFDYVDIETDLFSLIFYAVLRKAAFEDVYIEATDRCPFFLSQPDQAAVFSELWVLGSQCEIYFNVLPRELGDVVYTRYRAFLEKNPPAASARVKNEIMTMYSNGEPDPDVEREKRLQRDGSSTVRLTGHEKVELWKKRMTELGAMSIFCLPAIVDVLLLTFVGRGVFMTAFMNPLHLQAAGLALLIGLLITAGVTGWVGSTGNYYQCNYAYDNMIYFHIERLSGGFILTMITAVCGLIGFWVQYSVSVGFVFAAYLVIIATYFNLLGVMATMHQHGSPLTSGRSVLWRTFPVLLISPVLTAVVNDHDLEIYLPVTFCFLLLALYQYRRLCHEWSGWMDNIPKFSEKDVTGWYSSKTGGSGNDESAAVQAKDAQEALRQAVSDHQRGVKDPDSTSSGEKFIARVSNGMPYVEWLFKKTCPGGRIPDAYSASWFTQLGESQKQQKQLARGLKEHNIMMLFRFARYDLGQNLGLFLVALMDRWVSIIMGARMPRPTLYIDARARYGVCFCILYFCFSVMLLDTTLQGYWDVRYKLSEEKLANYEHAEAVSKEWERRRLKTLGRALCELFAKITFVFGATTLLLWFLVDTPETIIIYYLYVLGYTGVIVFQFNRCFTTNVRAHITIILTCAAIGFVVGVSLRSIPLTADWVYGEIIAQNVASVLAATGTLLWSWKDWSSPTRSMAIGSISEPEIDMYFQQRLGAESGSKGRLPASKAKNIKGTVVVDDDGSYLAQEVKSQLCNSLESPNAFARSSSWSLHLLQKAVDMWNSRQIAITVSTRERFIRSGLEDVASFSQLNAGSLDITVGFLGEDEVRKTSWQQLQATLVAESIIFHVARAQFKLDHVKAIKAEHFLEGTVALSRRLDFEISLDDPSNLNRVCSRTGIELMKHLCLDLAVDASWETLPESVRRAIMNRINGEPVVANREFSRFIIESGIDLPTVDFHVNLCLQIFQKVSEKSFSSLAFTKSGPSRQKLSRALLRPVKINRSRAPRGVLQHWLRLPVLVPVTFVKWVAIISGAGSDIERELWYLLKGVYFRQFLLRIILLIWKFCWVMKNTWIYAIVIYQHPALVAITRLAQKGARRKLKDSSIIVELARKTITGFAETDDAGNFVLEVFDGSLKDKPSEKTPMFKAVYDEKLRLQSRVDNGTVTTTYNYQSNDQLRWPVSKEVNDENFQTVGFYDKYGRITRGTLAIRDKEFAFQYHYKETPRGSTDVLSADFKQIEPPSDDLFSVFWGVPLDSDLESFDWVPSERICRLVKVINGRTYVTEAEYQHRRDPFITTFLEEENGSKTAIASAPKVFEEEGVFMARPNNVSFDLDDLLIYHNKLQIRQMRRHSGRKATPLTYLNPLSWIAWWGRRVYQPIPTWRIRTELWSLWLKTETINAPTACWIDELALREEPLLRAYWRARDAGRLLEAKAALDRNTDQIVSAIDIQTDVSEVCLLPIRMSDLYAMGLGKDATQVTSRPENCVKDTEDRVSVIFNDIGCWPEAPGGVSNCRRDLVNGHSTIRNHVLAECANDFGIPRFQVEKNVQSLKLLPLWGLDGKTAHHGLIDNLLQSQVDEKISDTDVQRDIVGIFIPLIKDFVKGARTRRYSRADLIKYSNVMLSMSKYYEHKDYSRTWESKEVEKAWVDAWLVSYNDPDIVEPSKCFELERPSMSDFREALGIYLAYFFIFSVKIPDKCPRVFQSTHHGISSLFGMILRYRRGVTFGIWDHAILWRECCLNISPAQCELPISVQSMLLSGIGMATRLAYFHADVIMPCTSLFNPMWEAEIGTDRGKLGSKNVFNRRIDPIVNGISNMESFTPVDKVRTEKPTVVMLSNVQFIKGIKTAILAADIIVNRFGFKDYQLVVYGAKDRQPSYALEMAKLIVENNLSETVILAGFGKPKEVLKDAWLFMNSSISEGLPLAIGEAALAGVPIVATEVGATALVMTDPEDPDQRYGEVVPPNDPFALARAQLSILGMVGPWAKFTSEGPSAPNSTLPDDITPNDVEWLTQRMYDRTEDRRKLGLLSREVVLHSFHGNRYLREHEQMYWVQWHLAKMRDDASLAAFAAETYRFGAAPPLRYSELAEEEEAEPLMLEYAADMAAEDEGGYDNNEAAIKRTKSRKRGSLIRWQDFSTDVPKVEKQMEKHQEKHRSNRLSKQPPLAVVTEV